MKLMKTSITMKFALMLTPIAQAADFKDFQKVQFGVCENITKTVTQELFKLAQARVELEDAEELVYAADIYKGAMQLQRIQQQVCKVLVEDKVVEN